MHDQLGAAQKAGLRSATLTSSNVAKWSEIEASPAHNNIDVLLVSPERLANPASGKRVLNDLAGGLGLLVNGHEQMHEYGHVNCMNVATKNAYGITA